MFEGNGCAGAWSLQMKFISQKLNHFYKCWRILWKFIWVVSGLICIGSIAFGNDFGGGLLFFDSLVFSFGNGFGGFLFVCSLPFSYDNGSGELLVFFGSLAFSFGNGFGGLPLLWCDAESALAMVLVTASSLRTLLRLVLDLAAGRFQTWWFCSLAWILVWWSQKFTNFFQAYNLDTPHTMRFFRRSQQNSLPWRHTTKSATAPSPLYHQCPPPIGAATKTVSSTVDCCLFWLFSGHNFSIANLTSPCLFASSGLKRSPFSHRPLAVKRGYRFLLGEGGRIPRCWH